VKEIEALNAMGVAGVILDKAVYDGRLDLGMCLEAAGSRRTEEDDELPLF
jgi:phosphoribosylformimino-5-aminoimidazole carboxamide ribotide isomerase